MRKRNKIEAGKGAEEIACRHLREKGYQIIGKNLRGREGEIDLLARKGAHLVVVEVRSRKSSSPLTTGELVPYRKRRKVAQVAFEIIEKYRKKGDIVRFDVVVVTVEESGTCGLEHYESAFSPDGSLW